MTGWTRVSSVASLPDGRGVRVEAGPHRIAVFRVGDQVHAIGDLCTHAEASLAEGDLFDTEVECPRHGAAFDLSSGKPVSLPATQPVPVYQTKVEDGDLFICLDSQEGS